MAIQVLINDYPIETITHNEGDEYRVTGTLFRGGRFPAIHTKDPIHALNINLWRGSVWQKKAVTKKWVKVKTVSN